MKVLTTRRKEQIHLTEEQENQDVRSDVETEPRRISFSVSESG